MDASQKRAIDSHRRRLTERGMSRYEVRGLAQDKELVRKFARRLAERDEHSSRLRAEVESRVSGEPQRGGIYRALRRSPAVGAELDLAREIVPEREIDW